MHGRVTGIDRCVRTKCCSSMWLCYGRSVIGANGSYDAALRRNPALLEAIHAAPANFRVLTGERPTGRFHVGHYFGTLQNRVALQAMGVEMFVLIADYQVFTDRDSSLTIKQSVLDLMADYLAIGLDPERTCIFTHSYVAGLNQLLIPFLSTLSTSELSRNPTVKDEIRSSARAAVSGLMFTYPAHQAADILFCKGNLVPGGKDQLPHIETARLVARRFNDRFAEGQAYFPEPELLLSRAPLLLGVDGRKMGKSAGNAIELGMDEDQTADLIKRAKTDSIPEVAYDPVSRPEVANLILLGALCSGVEPEQFAETVGDGGARQLKELVTASVNEYFSGIRTRRKEYVADPGYLQSVLRAGNEHADAIADATLADVRSMMGMSYY